MSNLNQLLSEMGERAKRAASQMALLNPETKNLILSGIADGLESHADKILAANALDLEAAERANLSLAMKDRLKLSKSRVEGIANAVRLVEKLPDPVEETLATWNHPKGFSIQKVRVPIGVIGIIFESRPNVAADASVLCFKSGNATILRGGKEASHSNHAIVKAMQLGGAGAGMPPHAIQLVPVPDREAVGILAGMDSHLDLIIPRGGKGLIEAVVASARVPVIKHYEGICHVYVSQNADIERAVRIVEDSKTQKPGVCNALETLLVHEEIASDFLIAAWPVLRTHSVQLRGDNATRSILGDGVGVAKTEDWSTEYLDLILAVKVVSSTSEAIDHVNRYGSQHSDCIVTEDHNEAEQFLRQVDSACVYHNVSTRFSDGEEFGFGAEIGISTDKLHARGPMGLAELTSYQYRIRGEGQLKKD